VRYCLRVAATTEEDSAMYNVVVLAEQAMSHADAEEVASLHDAIEEPRSYHVVIPCQDAAAQVETTLTALGSGEVLVAPAMTGGEVDDVDNLQHAIDRHANSEVTASVSALRALGHSADGIYSCDDPIDALDDVVREKQANEVIVMTRPHVLSEFLHLDWTSKARRRLGVPILHLVEHEPIDGEAGAPEGITGM
jgi:hypothetical protein